MLGARVQCLVSRGYDTLCSSLLPACMGRVLLDAVRMCLMIRLMAGRCQLAGMQGKRVASACMPVRLAVMASPKPPAARPAKSYLLA